MSDLIKRIQKLSEAGRLVGESHPRAKLTDAQVDKIRDMYEEGMYGYRALAKHFGVSRELIAKICQYNMRITSIAEFKTVYIKAKVDTKVEK